MQGRLVPQTGDRIQSFPSKRWKDEFAYAAQVGFDYIEWIFDLYGYNVNPLANDDGIERMQSLVESSGVAVRSVCADYFIENTFYGCSDDKCRQYEQELHSLIQRCHRIEVNRIVLPFVDASEIKKNDQQDTALRVLDRALRVASGSGVEIHVETSLDPEAFAHFLNRLPHPMLKVNYDSGNSASLGYRLDEEFSAYGDRIGSVHIKDRVLGGGTVPLGTGNTDFPALFATLSKIHYTGDFTFQVARGKPGDEIEWARRNLEFIAQYWPR